MSFPNNPVNNQTTIINGITYQYSSAKTTWIRQMSTVTSTLTTVGNVNILGNMSFSGLAPKTSLDLSTRTDGFVLPNGSSAQRPSPINGTTRYNRQIGAVEYYAGGTWTTISSQAIVANIQYLYANNTVNPVAQSSNITLGGNILINGAGFTANDSVFINGGLVSSTFLNPGQIIVTVPNSSVGTATVAIVPYVSNQANVLYVQNPSWGPSTPIFTYNTAASYSLVSNVIVPSGDAPASFALTGGSLPNGILLSGNGLIYGTDLYAGAYNFSITATDTYGLTTTNSYSGSIALPTITITPTTLGTLDQTFTMTPVTFSSSGGIGPYTYAVTGGTFPSGLNLSTSGTVTGAPTTYGSYSFTVTATDAHGYTGSQLITGITTQAQYPVNYLLVAGGGGGGTNWGSGGGAGGLIYATYPLTIGVTYTLTIGGAGGGAPSSGSQGSPGANTTMSGGSLVTSNFTAIGGGGASSNYGSGMAALAGGSGGGGNQNGAAGGTGLQPASASGGYGNNGGSGRGSSPYSGGGGGGGAGAVGGNGQSGYAAGVGGAGLQFAQFAPYGTAPGYPSYPGSGWFAGGGGGGTNTNPAAPGGAGGGGVGGYATSGPASASGGSGTPNTGGGGGGGSTNCGGGAGGGSGIAIISYTNPAQRGSGGAVRSANPGCGTVWYHTFTGTGNYTA